MYNRTGVLVQNKFWEYLFPTMMTSLAMSLASVVDSAIVGNLLGDTALAAVGLSSPLIFILNTIYMLFGIGGMAAASIAKGQLDKKKANQIFTATMVGGMAVMCVFVLIVNVFITPITLALSAGDEALAALTADYLRPLVFAGPTLMFSSGLALFVRIDGKPKSSAMIVMIANAVNLLFDFCLIRYFNFGIAGAGLSTALGYLAGGAVVLPYLFSKKRSFSFDFTRNFAVFFEVIKTGFPKALIQITAFFRAIILNGIIMISLGTTGMSIMTVCVNMLMVSNVFVGGTSDSLLPIVGTLYGEKDYFGINQTIKKARTFLIFSCLALIAFFMITPQTVGFCLGIQSGETMDALIPAVRMFALYLPFQAINTTLQNFYNITNRKSLASTIATLDGFVYVCIFAFALTRFDGQLFWLCYACSGFLTTLSIIFITKRRGKKEKVSGLLLLKKEEENGVVWDLSLTASNKEAVDLSAKIIEFSRENGLDPIKANHIGIAVEEIVAKIVSNTENSPKKVSSQIDILLKILPEQIILRFRDNGPIFDPINHISGEENSIDGIDFMKKMATKVDYALQLGYNTTIFILDK